MSTAVSVASLGTSWPGMRSNRQLSHATNDWSQIPHFGRRNLPGGACISIVVKLMFTYSVSVSGSNLSDIWSRTRTLTWLQSMRVLEESCICLYQPVNVHVAVKKATPTAAFALVDLPYTSRAYEAALLNQDVSCRKARAFCRVRICFLDYEPMRLPC
jgi:hypothetical protein